MYHMQEQYDSNLHPIDVKRPRWQLLHAMKVQYLHEHGFEGHITKVAYWYRKVFNVHRGVSASARVDKFLAENPK